MLIYPTSCCILILLIYHFFHFFFPPPSYLYYLLYLPNYFYCIIYLCHITYVYKPYYLPLSHLHTGVACMHTHEHTHTHLYYLYTYHHNFTFFFFCYLYCMYVTACNTLSVFVVRVVWCTCPSGHLVLHIISPIKKTNKQKRNSKS